MKAVFLDVGTARSEDLDMSKFEAALPDCDYYTHTAPEDIAARVKDAEVIVTNKAVLTQEILAQATGLKLIAVLATGYNNIDIEAAKANGVTVCNVAGYSTPSVAQHVFSFALAFATKLEKYNQEVREGQWQSSQMFTVLDFPIFELAGKSIGIVGYGALGRKVAQIAQAFDMEVLIAERLGTTTIRDGRLPFEKVIKQADIVTLHCPLTGETENLIGAVELAMMKDSAILINTARGGIVNEQDLADALRQGAIAGAGVDVLTQEPPSQGNPLLEKDVPNLFMTPHTAWASQESRQRLIDEVAENVTAFYQGNPRNIVV